MKVEVYVEVQATKPHPQGGEAYDPEGETSWKLMDSISSSDPEIIAATLYGIADEVNPENGPHTERKQPISVTTNWRVVVTEDVQGGGVAAPIIGEVISKKNGVIGAMLRGTARSITKDPNAKKPVMRN